MSIEEYLARLDADSIYELAAQFEIDAENKDVNETIALIIMANYSMNEIDLAIRSWEATEYPWYGQ